MGFAIGRCWFLLIGGAVMKKCMLLIAIIVPLFFSFSAAISGEIKTEKKDPNVWEAYSPEGEFVGTIKKEKERVIFYDKDEIKLKDKDKNEWEMYNQKDEFVGTLIKNKEHFKFYNKQEKYQGIIIGSKKLMPRGHRTNTTQLTPEAAKLYLDVLEAIEKIK